MLANKPTFKDIADAAERIANRAVKTPLLSCERLNSLCDAEVFVKPECLQRTGSFKFRGAYNAISQLRQNELDQGIISSSSGNHAQGVAAACALLGARATIIMPADAPQLKVERTKAHGADVRFYDRASEDRELVAKQTIAEIGGTFIHPFEHPDVIAGQGTVGLEIANDLHALGKKLDRVLVCTGGGGLTAGVLLAVKNSFPDAEIHAVEPQGFDDYRRSLAAGERLANPSNSGSICDAILTPMPGKLSFAICKDLLSETLTISDDEALSAMKFAFQELKLVLEPGGAAALAAMLQAANRWSGETIVVVASGGNVDAEVFAKALEL